jgi:hypothetical protein
MLVVHSCTMRAEPREPYYFRVHLQYIQLRDLILFSPLILFSHLILLKDFFDIPHHHQLQNHYKIACLA